MISRQYRTVFVHIPKTAGQSVELAFLEAAGLTWRQRPQLLLRRNGDPTRGPARLAHLYAREYVANGHMSAADFAGYFKFAMVRDPYARIVSEFNYRKHRCSSIRELVEAAPADDYTNYRRHVAPQTDYLFDADRGSVVVDRIVRFETLNEEIPEIFRQIFGADRPLTHRNAPSVKKLTVETLSKDDVAFINETYAEDFERFGYKKKIP